MTRSLFNITSAASRLATGANSSSDSSDIVGFVSNAGSSTGRDGIGGCSVLASHEFGEDEEKRPTVQIGDPFTEKRLIEACLEAAGSGALVAMKDMGAAGVTCTTSEMAAAGGVGMRVDLARIPRREPGMDFQSAVTAGLAGLDDPTVLALAAHDGRALVTHDQSTMPEHFSQFIAEQTSPGLLIVSQHLSLSIAVEDKAVRRTNEFASQSQCRAWNLRSFA